MSAVETEMEPAETQPAPAGASADGLPARIRQGDRSAAATLFERHGDLVYRYLRGCGAPRDEAEDLTQDVFIRAIAGAASYRGRASVAAWQLGIARNRLVDHARAEVARARREEAWAGERGGPGGPEGRLVAAEKLADEAAWAGADPDTPSAVSGFFIVRAAGPDEALRTALESPHARRGGVVEVRAVEEGA